MTSVLALVLSGTMVGLHGHRPLLWLAERRVDPTILLTGWMVLSVGLVGSSVTMIGFLALPTDEHQSVGLFQLAGGCWSAVAAGRLPGWQQAFAAANIALTGYILVRLWCSALARARARRLHAPHLHQLRLLARGVPSGEPLWVNDDRAIAVSIGGRPGIIIATEGLRKRLSPAAVEATLEHERAHLRGRHHVLVTVAEILAAALPWCPLLRAAPAATKDLVELAADARAARRCGPEAVRTALRQLTGHRAPAYGLGAASRLVELRISRLTSARGIGRLMRWSGSTAMALSALTLPAATGWLGMHMVGCVVA